MRRSRGWSMLVFHGGHQLLHVLPTAVMIGAGPPPRWSAGLAAALVHAAWALMVSGGTLNLDTVYVPLPTRAWRRLLYLAWAAEALTPALAATLAAVRSV